MITFKHRFSILFIALISLVSLTSCDEDWWDGYSDFDGLWRIVEVSGSSNYTEGDTWYFQEDGYFETYGYGGLYEKGFWERRGNRIEIYFDSHNPDIEAYVRNFEGDYMVLEVTDYGYGTRGVLRMVKEYDRMRKEK